jgi:hypothetical protein
MKQLELEGEIDGKKISVIEKFFKSIPFVRKMMTISPRTEKSADDTPVKTKLSDNMNNSLIEKIFIQLDDRFFDQYLSLYLIDIPFDDRDIPKGGERIISCPYCKRTEFILIRNTLSNFGKNIDNLNTFK